MKALKGGYYFRAKAIEAGCDMCFIVTRFKVYNKINIRWKASKEQKKTTKIVFINNCYFVYIVI